MMLDSKVILLRMKKHQSNSQVLLDSTVRPKYENHKLLILDLKLVNN